MSTQAHRNWDVTEWPFVALVEREILGVMKRRGQGRIRVWRAESMADSCACDNCLTDTPLAEITLHGGDEWTDALAAHGWEFGPYDKWAVHQGKSMKGPVRWLNATGPIKPRTTRNDTQP